MRKIIGKIFIIILVFFCISKISYAQWDSHKNFPKIIDVWVVGANHTGTTTETTIRSVSIPAGTVKVGNVLKITTAWSWTNNANAKTAKVKLGTTAYVDLSLSTSLNSKNQCNIAFIASASQIGFQAAGVGTGGWGAGASAQPTSTYNESQDMTINITGTLANIADTLRLEGYTIEIM